MSERTEKHDEKSKQTPPPEKGASKIAPESEFGYDYFTERKGKRDFRFWNYLNFFDKYKIHQSRCYINVQMCYDDPMVKVMLNAMKEHGCEVKMLRHVQCEECSFPVNGGFDPKVNQIVVCQNRTTSPAKVCGVMGHELTHMFDYCRSRLNFKSLEHLACTEIRAANFWHCAYKAAYFSGDASMWNYDKAHQKCVKRRAYTSMMSVRNVTKEEAMEVIDRVFDRCYSDMEPFGRAIYNREDVPLANVEGHLFGYRHGKPKNLTALEEEPKKEKKS